MLEIFLLWFQASMLLLHPVPAEARPIKIVALALFAGFAIFLAGGCIALFGGYSFAIGLGCWGVSLLLAIAFTTTADSVL